MHTNIQYDDPCLCVFRLTAHSWTPSTKPTSAALLMTPAASTDDSSHPLSSIHTAHPLLSTPNKDDYFFLRSSQSHTHLLCLLCTVQPVNLFALIATKKAVIKSYKCVCFHIKIIPLEKTNSLQLRITYFWHKCLVAKRKMQPILSP